MDSVHMELASNLILLIDLTIKQTFLKVMFNTLTNKEYLDEIDEKNYKMSLIYNMRHVRNMKFK